ncbi:MAG: hypothetical protein SCARUB_02919 [Candidatus Scalindua rubra]|uniref:DUF2293 domain-containing protein n=1 Tax=Candidatus Scalindua rubra TaxID=1872076 RepID=A0A1E3X8J7_9BACT|nr:MAG: hypothetical protein SCARUB_02919 [Candidatus Scalindua rubra]
MADEIKVFISSKESTCDECSESLGRHAWITLNREKGALCLAETEYDELLAKGYDRLESRSIVEAKVGRILAEWEGKATPSDLQSEY